jgi:hypothetical protein
MGVETRRFVATYEMLEDGTWKGLCPEAGLSSASDGLLARYETLAETKLALHEVLRRGLGPDIRIDDRVL